MLGPTMLCLSLAALPVPTVSLLRLDPATPLEVETLESIRAQGAEQARFSSSRASRAVDEAEARQAACGPRVDAAVWVEEGDAALVVHLVRCDGPGASERSIERTPGRGEAVLAEAASALALGGLAALLRAPAVSPPTQAVVAAPAVVAPVEVRAEEVPADLTPPQPRWRFSAGYQGLGYGDGLAWHSGICLAAAVRLGASLWLQLSGAVTLLGQAGAAPLRLSLDRQQASVGLAWRWRWGSFAAGVGASFGVERTRRATVATPADAPATQPAEWFQPLAAVEALAAVKLWGPVWAAVVAGVDSSFRAVSHQFEGSAVVRGWWVRPRTALMLAVEL
jgi:hypothetical protein